MKIVSSTLKRAAVPAVVAGLVIPVFATPAAAQTPGATAFRFFGNVGLSARAGYANNVTASIVGTNLRLTDNVSGIAAGPGCRQAVAFTTVDCPLPVSRLSVQLGDGNDSFTGTGIAIRTVVDASTGIDTVTTGSGNDTVGVEDDQPGDTVDCGAGTSDVVFYNSGDTVANCEARYVG